MIRLAIQAKGRLNEESLDLLKESGLVVEPSKKKLLTKCGDFPLEILFLRDDDIPQAVSMGVADIGIVGLNEVEERSFIVDKVHNLAFGKCRLSLAIPKSENYTGIGYFEGKRIATSYPVLLERYFKKVGITAEIHQIAGSVEIAPSVGLADAIFDIVSSGGTLITNGLKEVVSVMDSQAVLIATPNMESDKKDILKQLMMRFEAVERSKGMKYLLMNLPLDRLDDATEMLPGMRSPTILPLAQKGWCSVHVVVEEKQLWDRIEGLKSIGAEGILVLSLEKMMP
ncbi:MAG: ATP phosphoribosyltransferase [Bacteroidales bacterium]|jgi:ATP phosphoribosyltransferase